MPKHGENNIDESNFLLWKIAVELFGRPSNRATTYVVAPSKKIALIKVRNYWETKYPNMGMLFHIMKIKEVRPMPSENRARILTTETYDSKTF